MNNTKFKELRLKNKYTQDYMAKYLNVSRTAYRRYESGEAEPTYETLKRLARFYNVSIDFLLDYKVTDLTVKSLADEMKTLNREQLLEILEDFLKTLLDLVIEKEGK